MAVRAEVQGSRAKPYTISIDIDIDHENGYKIISGDCSCPMEFNCKHVAAVLLEFVKNHQQINIEANNATEAASVQWLKNISQQSKGVRPEAFKAWLDNLKQNVHHRAVLPPEENGDFRLLYLLALEPPKQASMVINLVLAKPLKKGGYGTQKTFYEHLVSHYKSLLTVDHDILHTLEIMDRKHGNPAGSLYKNCYRLSALQTDKILEAILKTERCYWQAEPRQLLLSLGPEQTGRLVWEIEETGVQKLICEVNEEKVEVLPLKPAWYIQKSSGICGRLLTNGADPWLFTPPLLPTEVKDVSRIIKQQFQNGQSLIPLPQSIAIIEGEQLKPRAKLVLFGMNPYADIFDKHFSDLDSIPLGRLTFLYEGVELQFDAPEQIHVLDRQKKQLKKISRQFPLELEYVNCLLKKGGSIFSKRRHRFAAKLSPQDFLITEIGREDLQKEFLYQTVPELRTLGWEIFVDPSFPIEYVLPVDEWYSELHETSEYDWFSMELGFLLNGQKVNILPLLTRLIQQSPTKFTERLLKECTEKDYHLTLADGQIIQIPLDRIKGILAILSELYDEKSLNQEHQLLVSRLRANQLLDLEKAMQTTQLRWLGAERLQELNAKLSDFKAIKPVKIPRGFQGQLRDYQKQGLDWLGFLKEYQLGGILSDDMGLGKTVQVLTHLLAEKEQERLKKPCLVIAPTSLMNNWNQEAKRFTPSLSVITLHGQSRKQFFNEIQTADLVLTTYSLIIRDQELLLGNEYEMVILDEAQYIKNAKTNAYQVLQQLRTQHRLCLTGTPMENHLGELWSLFNFLSPGLLGSAKQFSQIFRTPIEKQGNIARQHSLNQRIYPYMLRRTKEQVVQELPPKTEIICNIELPEEQRDLYESIRVSVEHKLKQAIAERGIAGSQIFILDALLKLRQVCCDPRLLKLEQAKKIKTSEKLNYVLGLLKELVEGGRKILLFSSFASMLLLIEEELKKQMIQYVKLTGSTQDRVTPIQAFQTGEVPVFLISLKAGGTGLNLTAADTVIHYDPWWNPAAEAQATDRAHRIGQTKSIFVYKLVTTGTVEEKILMMQHKKRALLDGLFENQNKTDKIGLTKEDLSFLFKPIDEVHEMAV